jgi:hypothetical protein
VILKEQQLQSKRFITMSVDCDVAKCRKNENGVFLFERAQTLPYCPSVCVSVGKSSNFCGVDVFA